MSTPQHLATGGSDRLGHHPPREEPRAHPRTMLVLAVIATVLAISGTPPRSASGGTTAESADAAPKVLAIVDRGAWLAPMRARLGTLGSAVSAGAHALSAQSELVEQLTLWRSRLIAGVDAVGEWIYTTPAASSTPASPETARRDAIAHAAWLDYLAAYSVSDEIADVTESIDPQTSGFGCPDGTVNEDDLLYRLTELTLGL